MANIALVNQS